MSFQDRVKRVHKAIVDFNQKLGDRTKLNRGAWREFVDVDWPEYETVLVLALRAANHDPKLRGYLPTASRALANVRSIVRRDVEHALRTRVDVSDEDRRALSDAIMALATAVAQLQDSPDLARRPIPSDYNDDEWAKLPIVDQFVAWTNWHSIVAAEKQRHVAEPALAEIVKTIDDMLRHADNARQELLKRMQS